MYKIQKKKKADPRLYCQFFSGCIFFKKSGYDIKEILGVKVLYLAVHDTRYNMTVKLNTKDNSEIITTLFRH